MIPCLLQHVLYVAAIADLCFARPGQGDLDQKEVSPITINSQTTQTEEHNADLSPITIILR